MDQVNIITSKTKYFCLWLAAITISGIFLVVFFAVVIDPYNLYNWFKYEGINTKKPDTTRYLEEIKLTEAIKLNPNLIILGNSRAEIGFDPESPYLIDQGYSAFNLAIRGTSIFTSTRQLNYLLNKGVKPKKILIALDFIDFLSPLKIKENNISPHLLETAPATIDQWLWRFDSLFSITTIKDSITTLLIQNNPEAASLTERGFNPLKEYVSAARNEGYYVLFRQRAEENTKNYLKKSSQHLDKTDFLFFQEILKSAISTDSQVIVIIYPYHAQILALLEYAGLLPLFSEWKSEIIDQLNLVKESSGYSKFEVLDFSGYGEYQCESIPSKGDLRSTTKWYWEAGHFKSELGNIVIENSLRSSTNPPLPHSNFGKKLQKSNLVQNQERMFIEREACINTHPAIFNEAKLLIDSARTKTTH